MARELILIMYIDLDMILLAWISRESLMHEYNNLSFSLQEGSALAGLSGQVKWKGWQVVILCTHVVNVSKRNQGKQGRMKEIVSSLSETVSTMLANIS
jgi:hypothetical protein